MTDFEKIELALRRARSRAIEDRVQDPSVIAALDVIIEEIERIIEDHVGEP